MNITACNRAPGELNGLLQSGTRSCTVTSCLGERFIGAGLSGKRVTLEGTPGNALGAYLDGATLIVRGNAQDAVGDTMNDGEIIIHGNAGDAAGYAMRGGKIYIKGNAGFRAGIHMKAYAGKLPVMVIGGSCGSFLGEYQAGGIIIVLGNGGSPVVGDFCGTGMHGGRIFLATAQLTKALPPQVRCEDATLADKRVIAPYIHRFARLFGGNAEQLLQKHFFVLSPNSANPYKQLYVEN